MAEPTTMNQYAPPLSEVADAPASGQVGELKLFSSRGRIGRLRYLAYATGASLVHTIALAVVVFGLGPGAVEVATWASTLVLLWFSIVTGIKRCHDMNISGWWSLTLIVPLIVLAWVFWPGSRADNRFGPPPPPNTWGVRVLGVLMPLFFFGGIIAAVSIPAYKNYTDRARAAQAAGQR